MKSISVYSRLLAGFAVLLAFCAAQGSSARYSSPALSFAYPAYMQVDEQRGPGQPTLKSDWLDVAVRSGAENTTRNEVFSKIMSNMSSAPGWSWQEHRIKRIGSHDWSQIEYRGTSGWQRGTNGAQMVNHSGQKLICYATVTDGYVFTMWFNFANVREREFEYVRDLILGSAQLAGSSNAISARANSGPSLPNDLAGSWRFSIGGIGGRFTFRSDGTYEYSVGEGVPWLQHEGVWSLRAKAASDSRDTLYRLKLEPQSVTRRATDWQLARLYSNHILDDEAHTYTVKQSEALSAYPPRSKNLCDVNNYSCDIWVIQPEQ